MTWIYWLGLAALGVAFAWWAWRAVRRRHAREIAWAAAHLVADRFAWAATAPSPPAETPSPAGLLPAGVATHYQPADAAVAQWGDREVRSVTHLAKALETRVATGRSLNAHWFRLAVDRGHALTAIAEALDLGPEATIEDALARIAEWRPPTPREGASR